MNDTGRVWFILGKDPIKCGSHCHVKCDSQTPECDQPRQITNRRWMFAATPCVERQTNEWHVAAGKDNDICLGSLIPFQP